MGFHKFFFSFLAKTENRKGFIFSVVLKNTSVYNENHELTAFYAGCSVIVSDLRGGPAHVRQHLSQKHVAISCKMTIFLLLF